MLESSAVLYCEYKRFDELKSESLVSQIAQSNTSGGSVTVLFEACADPGTCRGTIQHQMQILLLLKIILWTRIFLKTPSLLTFPLKKISQNGSHARSWKGYLWVYILIVMLASQGADGVIQHPLPSLTNVLLPLGSKLPLRMSSSKLPSSLVRVLPPPRSVYNSVTPRVSLKSVSWLVTRFSVSSSLTVRLWVYYLIFPSDWT